MGPILCKYLLDALLWPLFHGGLKPGKIGRIARCDRDCNDFGNFVGVKLEDSRSNRLKSPGIGLDEKQKFSIIAYFPFPAVNGADSRKDVDAGGLALPYEGGCDFLCQVKRIGGA
jgi:hypothetical protein